MLDLNWKAEKTVQDMCQDGYNYWLNYTFRKSIAKSYF
jgi:hypothetical protein